MATVRDIADRIAAFAIASSEAFVRRFCPDDRLPSVVAGYRSYERTESSLLRLYAHLLRLGVDTLNGRPIAERLSRFLGQIRGEDYETWWSLFIADTLQMTGPRFAGHPLLAPLTEAQRQQVLLAMDSTHVVDVPAGKLIGKPNNYWMVMALLEKARLELGVITDPTVFNVALAHSREVLCTNPTGFIDDDQDGRGRYDIYSFGCISHAEVLADRLPDLRRGIAAHERLMCATARPDGGGLAWGRSAELTSLTYMPFGAFLLRQNMTPNRPVILGLLAHAFERLAADRWADDALTVHRHRMTHWYMGEFRLLEHSLNTLTAIANTAWMLRQVAAEDPGLVAETRSEILFPPQDAFIRFDERGPGVWCYRRGDLAFQLALVDGFTSDYVAAPVFPGFLEQPVDKGFACGVPNVFFGPRRYLPLRRPTNVRYEPGQLSWSTECFTWFEDFDWWKPSEDRPGRRDATVRVAGDALEVQEHWTFDQVPDALAIHFAETLTPLRVEWHCDQPHHAFAIAVEGMREWRSYWHEIRRVHQLDIVPAREVRLRYRIARVP